MDDPLEPTVQGAILLQSLLRLDEPHNLLVTERYARHLYGILPFLLTTVAQH
jgi:hypothetical protein